jgi:predicted dehydrogenase
MHTTRIGLAGYGFGGRFFQAPLLAAAPSVEFAGVVTRSPERRDEVADAVNCWLNRCPTGTGAPTPSSFRPGSLER